jgi:hypothetical protein
MPTFIFSGEGRNNLQRSRSHCVDLVKVRKSVLTAFDRGEDKQAYIMITCEIRKIIAHFVYLNHSESSPVLASSLASTIILS